jgi:hypothetical protein
VRERGLRVGLGALERAGGDVVDRCLEQAAGPL